MAEPHQPPARPGGHPLFWNSVFRIIALGLALVSGPSGRAAEPPGIEPLLVKEIPDTVLLCVTGDLFPEQIAAFVKEGTSRLRREIDAAHVEVTGPLQYMGPKWNGDGKISTYTVAIPVKARMPGPAGFTWVVSGHHRVAALRVHVPPGSVSNAWDHIRDEAAGKGLRINERWTEVQLSPDGSLVEIQADVEP